MVDVFDKTPGLRDRIIATMNACAGMVDPAAEIQAMRLAAPVWQPIETAPLDGSWMLVTCGGENAPAVVFWDSEIGMWIENENDSSSWILPADWPLTHWTPLPTPPQV